MSASHAFLFAAAVMGCSAVVIALAIGLGFLTAEHPVIGIGVAVVLFGAALMAFAMLMPFQ